MVMLKSKTELWSLSNYQAFMLLDNPLSPEQRESDLYHLREFHCTAKLLEITGPCLILFFMIVLFIQSAPRQCAFKKIIDLLAKHLNSKIRSQHCSNCTLASVFLSLA